HWPWALMRMITGRAVAMIGIRHMVRDIVARVFLCGSIVSSLPVTARVLRLVMMTVGIMNRVLDVFARCPARFAPEGQEHQAPGIEAGQQRSEGADPERSLPHFAAAGISRLEDRVLRIEAREAEHAEHTD